MLQIMTLMTMTSLLEATAVADNERKKFNLHLHLLECQDSKLNLNG